MTADDNEEPPTYMLDLMTDYVEKTLEYEGEDGAAPVRQTVLGWSMGGCDTVWSRCCRASSPAGSAC